MNNVNRNQTIDVAKGIAIILMVIGHCFPGDNLISRLIYGFHMPFFFMISGVIYADKWKNGIRISLLTTAKKLLIPYFIFDSLYALFLVLLRQSTDPLGSFLKLFLCEILPLRGSTATWYLPCYLMALAVFLQLPASIAKRSAS